jgi:hypothetical protein
MDSLSTIHPLISNGIKNIIRFADSNFLFKLLIINDLNKNY